MAHLTRPDGRVVEVDDANEITKLLGYHDFRNSTVDEITQYSSSKLSAITKAQISDDDTGTDAGIYYQTVSPGPDGYGMSRDIIKQELFQLGVKLEEDYSHQKVGFLYSIPNQLVQMENQVRILMTMFESDKLPHEWPEYLAAADEVLVPSKWCAEVFLRAGVETTVVPLGYNDRVFKYVDRDLPFENENPFTFIHYGSFNDRKGFWEVFEAFNKEFMHNEPVRLILKTTDRKPPIPILPSEYPQIEVVAGQLPEQGLVDLLSRANCMVYPSRGEGFGITPLEAMATGLPTIVPNAHGISEYFNAKYMLEVKATDRCPAVYARFKGQDVGEMVICDIADLRRQMRYAYNNQVEMRELGQNASEYVKAWTYAETAKKLAKILQDWQNTEPIKLNDSKYLKVETV